MKWAQSSAALCLGLWLTSSAAAQNPPSNMTVTVAAGGGVTARLLRFESSSSEQRFDTGWLPAASARVKASLTDGTFRLDMSALYQTSLGGSGVQYTPEQVTRATLTPLRSHRFEAGVLPSARVLGSGAGLRVGAFAGYGLRALGSVAPLQVPRYTLHGPLLRLEISTPLVGPLRLRLAPEGGLIFSITRDLRTLADTHGLAYAVGGEAALFAHLLGGLNASLVYRESHAIAPSGHSLSLHDIERFAVLALDLSI